MNPHQQKSAKFTSVLQKLSMADMKHIKRTTDVDNAIIGCWLLCRGKTLEYAACWPTVAQVPGSEHIRLGLGFGSRLPYLACLVGLAASGSALSQVFESDLAEVRHLGCWCDILPPAAGPIPSKVSRHLNLLQLLPQWPHLRSCVNPWLGKLRPNLKADCVIRSGASQWDQLLRHLQFVWWCAGVQHFASHHKHKNLRIHWHVIPMDAEICSCTFKSCNLWWVGNVIKDLINPLDVVQQTISLFLTHYGHGLVLCNLLIWVDSNH